MCFVGSWRTNSFVCESVRRHFSRTINNYLTSGAFGKSEPLTPLLNTPFTSSLPIIFFYFPAFCPPFFSFSILVSYFLVNFFFSPTFHKFGHPGIFFSSTTQLSPKQDASVLVVVKLFFPSFLIPGLLNVQTLGICTLMQCKERTRFTPS